MTSNFLLFIWNTIAPGLGNHLWQSTLFAMAMWLLTLLWRKNQAQARYWLWMAASLKFLVPFSLLIALGGRLAGPRAGIGTKTSFIWTMEQVTRPFTSQPPISISLAPPAATSSRHTDLLLILFVSAWLLGLVVVLLIWSVRWRRISRIIRRSVPLEAGRELQALKSLEGKTRLKLRVRILLSRTSVEPGVFGIFHPVLLWPEGISERLGDEHLEAILAHELWHVRRRDNLAAVIHMFVEAVFWFHPLVWWMGARLVEERERACDQEVLALGSQRQVYAESILKTCEFCVEAPLACMSGVAGADLKERIVRIMTQRLAEKLSLSRKLLLAAIGAVTIAGPVIFGLLHAPQVRAQSPQTSSATSGITSFSYEVASIKPNKVDDGRIMFRNAPDGFTANGITPKFLIEFAYNLKDFQVSGAPGWAESDRYDIDAKMDEATIEAFKKLTREQSIAQRRLMLQSLLAERFKLKVSHSSKEAPIYALVVAKNGPKLTQSADSASGPAGTVALGQFRFAPGELNAVGMLVSNLADQLSREVGRQVVDKTGLQGRYDFRLHWTPDRPAGGPGGPDDAPPPDSSGPSIFSALQEQLGLKLEPQKGPVETLIIDSIQRPTDN